MIQSRFKQNEDISSDDPIVIVQAKELTEEISHLMSYINRYQGMSPTLLTVKSDDRILMIKPADIILVDIVDSRLLLTTQNGVIMTNDTLRNFLKRISNPNFIQISKHAVLNMNHLLSLSASFSGNMSARLSHNVKTDVSRKYVKSLMERLEV
ncbi:LytTR family DNA-binding domain-containing protein [Pediococcus siamensis]|uniref:LytTR family DNA-binding domain-containing protein n=1 Tax=Pediococcus siamensis TaxID=381829 RepID=UPI00399F2F10